MKKYLQLLLLCLFLNISLVASEDLNVSTKIYKNIDEQKIFNMLKEIYKKDSSEHLINTSWDKLHIMHRSAYTLLIVGMRVSNIVVHVIQTKDKSITKMTLEIFIVVDDEKRLIPPDSLAHKIFWNRIDYALGLGNEWIECDKSDDSIFKITYPYCHIREDELEL